MERQYNRTLFHAKAMSAGRMGILGRERPFVKYKDGITFNTDGCFRRHRCSYRCPPDVSMGMAVAAWCPLPGRGAGGERPFDDAMDVVAGGEAGGLVATRLVDQRRLAQLSGSDNNAVASQGVAVVKQRGRQRRSRLLLEACCIFPRPFLGRVSSGRRYRSSRGSRCWRRGR